MARTSSGFVTSPVTKRISAPGHLGEGGGVAAGDGHAGAGADEGAGDRRADAAAAAGDERVLAAEASCQTLPSMVSVRSARRQSWLRPGR